LGRTQLEQADDQIIPDALLGQLDMGAAAFQIVLLGGIRLPLKQSGQIDGYTGDHQNIYRQLPACRGDAYTGNSQAPEGFIEPQHTFTIFLPDDLRIYRELGQILRAVLFKEPGNVLLKKCPEIMDTQIFGIGNDNPIFYDILDVERQLR
jgi:hypothetical protein